MNQKIDLPRAAEELSMYAAVRLVGFEQHRMGDGFHQPEVRNEWVRDILQGMAEVCGKDAVPLLQAFDQRLEDASGSAGVEFPSLNDQKHSVQSLRQYVSALERTEGDQRSRFYNVKKLLEDMSAYCQSIYASPGYDFTISGKPGYGGAGYGRPIGGKPRAIKY